MDRRLSSLAVTRVTLTYLWRHRRLPRLARPRLFTEWVQWRKLHDRDLQRARLTDKAYSKYVAAATIGDALTIPTLWEGLRLPLAAPWPMPFIVKANHGCRQFVVVRTAADYARARREAPRWLARAYGRWLDEWHYGAARRSLIVEPLMGDDGQLPRDYKIYVFNGRAAMIQVHEDRAGNHRWSQYDCDWRPLSDGAGQAAAPLSLARMIAAAEKLGRGHDFLRVDFYEIAGQPLFGEFCLFPGSGLDPFAPFALDEWLGGLWSDARHEGELGRPAVHRARAVSKAYRSALRPNQCIKALHCDRSAAAAGSNSR